MKYIFNNNYPFIDAACEISENQYYSEVKSQVQKCIAATGGDTSKKIYFISAFDKWIDAFQQIINIFEKITPELNTILSAEDIQKIGNVIDNFLFKNIKWPEKTMKLISAEIEKVGDDHHVVLLHNSPHYELNLAGFVELKNICNTDIYSYCGDKIYKWSCGYDELVKKHPSLTDGEN